MSPPPPHIQDQLGGEKRWMMGARCTFTHPTTSCLVTGCLFLSLTTPPFHLSRPRPPPPPPLLHHLHPTAPPSSGGSGSPSAALSTPSPSRSFVFFFVFCSGRGPLSVVVLLHACPVFLHASSPPCRRHPKEVAAAVLVVVVVVFGQLTLLSPLCLQPSLFS